MIEKKFRAWDKESKMMSNIFDINGLPKFKDREYLEVVSSRFILMQYTGKKDKNKQEIYEKDLLKNESGRICEVYWNDICGCWDTKVVKTVKGDNPLCFEFSKWDRLERIGNTFEGEICDK